jgi:hypothetical protein
MFFATAISKNGIVIRLTEERWQHITEGHAELQDAHEQILETIRNPERILNGKKGELLAIAPYVKNPQHYLIVFYKEEQVDGFVITAFLTSKIERYFKIYSSL